MDRTAYKNRNIKEHYDRINFVIPKGEKDRIKKICSEIGGASVNEYLYMLVCNDLADGTSRMSEKKQGFNAEQERILEKWQVPKKYEMIEDLSYTKDEGYFIYLKKGYVNDVTGSRNSFQHYLYNGTVARDCNGVAYTGYIVEDLSTGFLVWGCYDAKYDHLWTLEDVEEFIKGEYEKAKIAY